MAKKLYKSATDKKLDGVLAGIGNYFNIDPTVIRAAFVILTLFSGVIPGIVTYVVLAAVMPREGEKSNG